VLDEDAAFALAEGVPRAAKLLARAFWPGPLTLVVPVRTDAVAPEVTAGGDTVAVRVPSHPVARALLEAARLPIAAPSANRSTTISPTRAAHVAKSFDENLIVVDGGPTGFGIESTIVDVTSSPARILRRGSIRRDRLAELVDVVDRGDTVTEQGEILRAPGGHSRHYAPRAPLEVFPPEQAMAALVQNAERGARVGWMTHARTLPAGLVGRANVVLASLPALAEDYERGLYAALHALDDEGVERIVVDAVPDDPSFDAIRDRLRRAGAPAR
jgi:L-threonylcarbamoyladenylate synthase